MKQFSLSDLSKRTSDVTHAAARGPVTITHRDRPRFMLLAVEDYDRITRRADDTRHVAKLSDMPGKEGALLRAGLDEILAGTGDD